MDKSKLGRWVGFLIALLIVATLLLYTAKDSVIKGEPTKIDGYQSWDEELVKEFGSLAVQADGRVKPVSTWAGFELLAINGKRKVRFESDGEKVKIKPVEWVLDAMFREDVANQMEIFQVEDSNVLDMIGMPHEGKKRRDRYSYNDIKPYLHEIDRVQQDISKQSKDDLDPVEKQFSGLYSNIQSYASITSHLTPVSEPMWDEAGPFGAEFSRFSVWAKKWPQLSQFLQISAQQGTLSEKSLQELSGKIAMRVGDSVYSQIALYPSSDISKENWPVRGGWLMKYFKGEVEADKVAENEDQLAYLEEMETLALAYRNGGQAELLTAVKAYREKFADVLIERGEGDKLKSETTYYRADYFYHSIAPFVFGFLVVAFGWVSPGSGWSRACNRIGWLMLIIGGALVIAGITHRSILMGRPPVGNLYDTIPFITAIAILVLGFIEYLTKRGVCLGLAFFLATAGMFLAMWYEESKGVDPMNPLIAVLRSNFWLATHVVTITIGYAGGLLTAGLAHVYIFARLFNIDEGDKSFRRFMTRIVYGGICFTLFFSLVGTILGGVWANDSWGRFWGWDPKENGALIIVLWTLIILHARMAGYIREWGIHICSVICAILVTFSWWHVNFLSIGLHNYGFTGNSGLQAIYTFYYLEIAVAAVAIGMSLYESSQKPVKQAKPPKLRKQD